MALYTVSSSGRLRIADTGVGLPVSIFYGDGTAIATSPLGGDFKKAYVFNGNYNRISSSGQLVVSAGKYENKGLLAGSALGELPLAGSPVLSNPVGVVLGHITLAWASSGNLVITGASSNASGHLEYSSGQLRLTGSDSQLSKRAPKSSGLLRVTGSVVAKTLSYEASSGNLKIVATASLFRSIRRAATAGSLLLTASSGESFNNYSSGRLKTTGNFTFNVFLKPTSTGLLTVATEWFTVNRIGGISTEALASAPIAAGSGAIQNIRHATIIGSYGLVGKNSSGLITFTPVGTPASDLSQDGTLAGSPLATNSIAEHRFNSDRTQFSQKLIIDSAGQLIFTNAVKYRIDSDPALLVLNGRAGFNNDRRSSGNLKVNGSGKNNLRIIELSNGRLSLTPSGKSSLGNANTLAGSPLGSVSIAGDGYSVPDRTQFTSLRRELSSGQLVLVGVAGIGVKRLSSGQLRLTGSVVTRSIRTERSAGQLRLTSSVVTRSIITERSAGQLVMAETDAYRIRWSEESRGQLTVSGSNVHRSLQLALTNGQLKLTGSVLTRSYRVELSRGNLTGYTSSQNPLSINNSGLAASPLGAISIAGGLDLPGNATLFRSIRNENSSGQLRLNGSNIHRSLQLELSSGQLRLTGSSLPSSLRKELSSGQLCLTGSDKTRTIIVERSSGQLRLTGVDVSRDLITERSAGQLRLTGSSLPSSLRKELSSGQLRLTGSDKTRTIIVERSSGQLRAVTRSQNPLTVNNSALAGSPLGAISIAGGFDLLGNNTLFRSIRNEPSSGNLVLSSRTASSSKVDSSGNLIISGNRLTRSLRIEKSSGNLIVNRTVQSKLIVIEHSAGQLRMAETDSYRVRWSEESRGQLKVSGSNVHRSLQLALTNGQLKLTSLVTTRSYRVELSRGNLTGYTTSQNPLSINNSGLAASPLGAISIAGGLDLTGLSTLFRSTRNEIGVGQLKLTGGNVHRSLQLEKSTGQLKLTGSASPSSTRRELSGGQLRLTGSDVTRTIIIEHSAGQLRMANVDAYRDRLNEASAGQLRLTGSALPNSTRRESSIGQLKLNGSLVSRLLVKPNSSGQLKVATSSQSPLSINNSGLAASPLGAISIAGGLDLTGYKSSFASLRNEKSSGQLRLTGTTLDRAIEIESSSGQLRLTGATTWARRPAFSSSGNLKVTGAFTKTQRYAKPSSGRLVLTPNGNNTSLSVSSTIAGGSLASSPLGGNYERTLLKTAVTFTLNRIFYNDTGYTGSSSGSLRLTGRSVYSIKLKESSSGQLRLSGVATNNVIRAEKSTGRLVLTSTTVSRSIRIEKSNGRLSITGSRNSNILTTRTSAGNLNLNGSTLSRAIRVEKSTGRLQIVGSAVTVFVGSGSVNSTGNLVLVGTSRVEVYRAAKPRRGNGGGSYVYATSWDILKPYFPDDRHILGYRELKTSGIGTVELFGVSNAEFIPAAPKVEAKPQRENILLKYIKSVEEDRNKAPITVAKPKSPVVSKFKQQALREDEMLLTGSLLDFEDPDDELDRELMLY